LNALNSDPLQLEIEKFLKELDKEWAELASPARQWTMKRNTVNFNKGYAQAIADIQFRLNGILERSMQARHLKESNPAALYEVGAIDKQQGEQLSASNNSERPD
jgi:hypothetical protein